MQKSLLVGFIAVLTFLAFQLTGLAVILPPSKTVTLLWEYSQPSPQIIFNVYHSTNAALPLNSWIVLTNVPNTSCSFPVLPGAHFFTVTASNTVSGLQSAL